MRLLCNVRMCRRVQTANATSSGQGVQRHSSWLGIRGLLRRRRVLLVPISSFCYSGVLIADESGMEEVEVVGRKTSIVGEAVSASQGIVGQEELRLRPLLRTGEILETVPGMVVTQHSGSGKANQFFLRGFNLDHGTDFRTTFDAMPVNMRSHGHGQGYTDINFVIPELVESIAYAKGPYYAEVGDFSGAGSAALAPMRSLDGGLLQLGAGENGFGRMLGAGSFLLGNGDLLLGVEGQVYEGPWTDVSEDVRKTNAIARYTWDTGDSQFAVMFMAYDNSWNSADQIPERAVEQGLIDRLGSIDDTTGGESSRYSLSASWLNPHWQASAYTISYRLNLWSNFTYFLDDPAQGDQFEQVDKRWIYGGELVRNDFFELGAVAFDNAVGLQTRYDDIEEVSLYQTQRRQRLGTVRLDAIDESSAALYWSGTFRWADRWRANLGLRYDHYWFDVDSQIAENSGTEDDGITSYKFNLSYQPFLSWETYLGLGSGFHSNDARGVTIALDPVSGEPVDSVDPLVRSEGGEIGARFFSNDRLNASMALWLLDLDSELLFVGDAGNTEPSRSSRRYGIELTAYWWLSPRWTLDAEYAYSRARFTEVDPNDPDAGDAVPGSVPGVFSAGLSLDHPAGWFGSARVRYFSPRPLDESGDIESDASTVVNLRAGFRWLRWELFGDVLNIFDSEDHDIDYFYASRLPGEPAAGIEDIHYHPLEPRTFRVYLGYQFGR
jgi:outer membrane receptor protein involved in Fe transport